MAGTNPQGRVDMWYFRVLPALTTGQTFRNFRETGIRKQFSFKHRAAAMERYVDSIIYRDDVTDRTANHGVNYLHYSVYFSH
jgi:hypothetical protein